MSTYRMRLPDVGEGVAEAELVQWFVAVGDEVTTESVLAEVLTDKATVEVSSPVAGVVTTLHGEPGDVLAVGSDLVEIETASANAASKAPTEPAPAVEPSDDDEPAVAKAADVRPAPEPAEPVPAREPGESKRDAPTAAPRPAAAPAVRERARSLGLNLADVEGSGPGGRIVHADLDRFITESTGVRKRPAPQAGRRQRGRSRRAGPRRAPPHRRAVDGDLDRGPAHHVRRRRRRQ